MSLYARWLHVEELGGSSFTYYTVREQPEIDLMKREILERERVHEER